MKTTVTFQGVECIQGENEIRVGCPYGDSRCTCNTEEIMPHECPFRSEIHGDEEQCKCCDFCVGNCNDEI